MSAGAGCKHKSASHLLALIVLLLQVLHLAHQHRPLLHNAHYLEALNACTVVWPFVDPHTAQPP